MTPKNLITAEFSEIAAVEVRCRCGAVVSFPVNREVREAFGCPACNRQLWGADDNFAANLMLDLIAALRQAHEHAKLQNRQFDLGFTLNAAPKL